MTFPPFSGCYSRRFRLIPLAVLVCALLAFPRSLPAQGYSPEDAPKHMTLPDGFEVSLVASEPLITQPVAIEFDDKGRLWAVQYIQYPNPEGLKRVKVDRYSRTTYDKVPEPPPHGPKGADCITILEDTDGDGRADAAKNFVEGLNLCTGLAFGHGGVYVINVPYLLFYPDRDRDDVPDGDPEVLVKGFGMEDAHSVANSLTWGPDGWLYGLQGSTVTANIDGIEFQQGIWRFHPVRKQFELFAEGGSNMWGMDFTPEGHLITCTNYGGYVALHAVQGGYYWKQFGKHGALHNPHTYGYFEHLTHDQPQGGHVNVGGVIYEADAFPPSFQCKFIAPNLLSHNVYWQRLEPKGSTFETFHEGELLNSNDTWFAPCDMTLGPDGALYVADWNDRRTAHPDPDAEWDRSNGRIYRIQAKGAQKVEPIDVGAMSGGDLLNLLNHPNKWFVRRAQVNLASHPDESLRERLTADAFENEDERLARNSFFALYGSLGLDDLALQRALQSSDPVYRRWAVRYVGDLPVPDLNQLAWIGALARAETDPHVVSQLASTAKRIPRLPGSEIVRALIGRDAGTGDLHIPLLLWWAVESQAIESADRWVAWAVKASGEAGNAQTQFLLPKLVRRFAADGTEKGDWACSQLVAAGDRAAPSETILAAIDDGLQDRVTAKPDEAMGTLFANYANAETGVLAAAGAIPVSEVLGNALNEVWLNNPDNVLVIRIAVRIGLQGALLKAVNFALNPSLQEETRAKMVDVIGRFGSASAAPALLKLVWSEPLPELRNAALNALVRNPDPYSGDTLLAVYDASDEAFRSRLRDAFFSRPDWAQLFVRKVELGGIQASDVPLDQVRALARHENPDLQALVEKLWGRVQAGTPEEKLAEMRRMNNELNLAQGDPAKGKKVFAEQCAKCHTFFGEGAQVGPELTQSNRMDREFLLASLVDPNLTIRKEYQQFIIDMNDGAMYNGLIAEQTPGNIAILNANGERVTLPMGDVTEIREAGISLMPEGLLAALTGDDVRNLFAYLQSPDPAAISVASAH
ncbi:MAG: hypothetical protein AMXMBFR84_24810 [Candidatus Hydrogenedentota bacterium]